MYSENVEIIVHGKKIIINVCCEPNMPEDRLKRLAVKKYLNIVKHDLYVGNGLIE